MRQIALVLAAAGVLALLAGGATLAHEAWSPEPGQRAQAGLEAPRNPDDAHPGMYIVAGGALLVALALGLYAGVRGREGFLP